MTARRALIVDDEPMNRQMLRDVLEIEGYSVADATNGSDGLEKAESLLPDIILLDLMMPGMDGYAVCRELKANPVTRPIPVIFVTASQDIDLNRLAYAAGAVACLPKPFRREGLFAIIEATLGNAERQRHPMEEGAPPVPAMNRVAPQAR